ncbi:uncharacterized protein TRIREDRAFT_109607, partial [Trichoderma reesei QM6a]
LRFYLRYAALLIYNLSLGARCFKLRFKEEALRDFIILAIICISYNRARAVKLISIRKALI